MSMKTTEELKHVPFEMYARVLSRAERAERAEAELQAAKGHIVDLEEIVKGVHFLRKRAEAECKRLQEALDALRERQKLFEDGNRPVAYHRDTLGRYVREAWVRWARTQPNPKPSWLVDYDDLPERDKEADRQIGECIARWTIIGDAARAALNPSPAEKHRADLERHRYLDRGEPRVRELEAEFKRLREALEPFAAIKTYPEPITGGVSDIYGYVRPQKFHEACEKARAALNPSPEGMTMNENCKVDQCRQRELTWEIERLREVCVGVDKVASIEEEIGFPDWTPIWAETVAKARAALVGVPELDATLTEIEQLKAECKKLRERGDKFRAALEVLSEEAAFRKIHITFQQMVWSFLYEDDEARAALNPSPADSHP